MKKVSEIGKLYINGKHFGNFTSCGPGRPKKDPSLVKSFTRSVRLTPGQLEQVEREGGLQAWFEKRIVDKKKRKDE